MGRKVFVTIAALIGVGLLLFITLGVVSHNTTPDLGVVDGKLQDCPNSPNCVCSEIYPEAVPAQQVPPIKVNGQDLERPWKLLRQAIIDQGGEIILEDEDYLHAEFTSSIFRFVDDLELRMDRQDKAIHIRSASRIGHSDLGANRQRIEAIWSRMGEVE